MGTKMLSSLRLGVAGVLALLASSVSAGQMTLYEHPGFQGRSVATTDALPNLERSAFDDVASSAVVAQGTWEACTEPYFRGTCAQLVPGAYGTLNGQLSSVVRSVREIDDQLRPARIVISPDATPVAVSAAPAPVVINPAPVVINPPSVIVNAEPPRVLVETGPTVVSAPIPAGPRVVLYQHTTGGIRAVELTSNVDDLGVRRFAASADSALVSGGVWRLCDHDRGRGQCTEYSPGQYVTLGALDRRVMSAYLVARVDDGGATPVAVISSGRVVLYQNPNFGGPTAVVENGRAPDIDWTNFRNPATSLRIEAGTWLVCSDIGYQGDCRVLDPGDYPVLPAGMSGIASARQVWRPEYGNLDLGHLDLRNLR